MAPFFATTPLFHSIMKNRLEKEFKFALSAKTEDAKDVLKRIKLFILIISTYTLFA